ncbi:hypothetical protein EYC80_009039 [Monilinia laxa]|uniref:Uncharacterized protein n=1 Tax=Monilinia laxa TaxID=61186 RepID=A0A5N6K2A7_MONLA|nr:hypothetical protein EYC80_009039 [Monilinia laxa]
MSFQPTIPFEIIIQEEMNIPPSFQQTSFGELSDIFGETEIPGKGEKFGLSQEEPVVLVALAVKHRIEITAR